MLQLSVMSVMRSVERIAGYVAYANSDPEEIAQNIDDYRKAKTAWLAALINKKETSGNYGASLNVEPRSEEFDRFFQVVLKREVPSNPTEWRKQRHTDPHVSFESSGGDVRSEIISILTWIGEQVRLIADSKLPAEDTHSEFKVRYSRFIDEGIIHYIPWCDNVLDWAKHVFNETIDALVATRVKRCSVCEDIFFDSKNRNALVCSPKCRRRANIEKILKTRNKEEHAAYMKEYRRRMSPRHAMVKGPSAVAESQEGEKRKGRKK